MRDRSAVDAPSGLDRKAPAAPSASDGDALGRARWTRLVATLLLAGVVAACGSEPPEAPKVAGHLQGRITVSAAVDSTPDYRGFEVLVVQSRDRAIDTLGYATTDSTGRFATAVQAEQEGVYPLLIRRRGETLRTGEYVVADGDSAQLRVELPSRGGFLRIQSPENAAWTAYRNTMALHRQTLTQRIQEADVTTEALEANVRRTTSVLWSLRDSYTGTLGAAQATTESLALLEGWNDSLVVARARQIEPSSPGYVEAARIARRAQARRAGQAAALQLVRTYQKQAQTDEQRAALQAELVRTHIDSLNADSALAAAQTLRRQYADSDWAEWAERARYEVENLLPGRPAPGFTARTMSGDTLTLDRLRGRPVMLEFYRPESRQYRGQLAARNALYEATRPDSLALVSVSLQPDTLLNEAFFEGRDVPGQHVIAPDGMEGALAEKYNIATTPTRFLIGADGRIIDKYVGAGFARLRDRAAALNRGPDAASDTSAASPPAAPAPDPAPPSRRP